MKAKTVATLSVLNDLRDSIRQALENRHRLPALLLIYSFIDICAAATCEHPGADNGKRFTGYLRRYYGPGWAAFTPEDLWASRSSLLHSYSPLGRNTRTGKARPVFYFSWPEREQTVRALVDSRGYSGYLLLDVVDVQSVATWCFNDFWRRVENEPSFETLVLGNTEHLLKDVFQLGLESELVAIETLVEMQLRLSTPD